MSGDFIGGYPWRLNPTATSDAEAVRQAALKALDRWLELPDKERSEERPYIMGFNAGWEASLAETQVAVLQAPSPSGLREVVQRLCDIAGQRVGQFDIELAFAIKHAEEAIAALASPDEAPDLTDEQWARVKANAPKPKGPLTPITPDGFAPDEAGRLDRVEEIISAWAFAHNIDGAARNDLFKRLRAALSKQPSFGSGDGHG